MAVLFFNEIFILYTVIVLLPLHNAPQRTDPRNHHQPGLHPTHVLTAVILTVNK